MTQLDVVGGGGFPLDGNQGLCGALPAGIISKAVVSTFGTRLGEPCTATTLPVKGMQRSLGREQYYYYRSGD